MHNLLMEKIGLGKVDATKFMNPNQPRKKLW